MAVKSGIEILLFPARSGILMNDSEYCYCKVEGPKEKKMAVKMNAAVSILLPALLIGCSAIATTPEGNTVELVTEKPTGNCKPLGDAVGSQGNWFTGDYTSNKNLLIGARNDLRNKAAKRGGNTVWVQDKANTNAWGGKGTSNTTVLGVVYRCE